MASDKTKKSTKDRIFEAAVELFSTKGFHGTSMRDLAREVGIKESSLYNHFSGKEAILKAILDYQITVFQAALPTPEEMEETAAGFTDPVKLWLTGAIDFVKKLPPLSEKISIILYNEMFLNEQCRNFVLHGWFDAQKDATEILIGDLHARGMIKDCDIRKTAVQYVYMLHGLGIENKLLIMEGHSPEEIQQRLIEHMTYFIEGLRKE